VSRTRRHERPDAGEVFRALADPTRRSILERLGDGPVSVSRLAEPLGITLAAVVQHVQVLEQSGLVSSGKSGRVRTCRIDSQGLDAAAEWIAARRTSWERRFDRLEEVLHQEAPPEAEPE
jgi:DNA-binding transcriptional ArsR family regulator